MFYNWDDPKTIINLLSGVLLTAFGVIPLLNKFGLISWSYPSFVMSLIADLGLYIIAGFGAWLLIDGFLEDHGLRIVTILIALLVMIFGLIPLLNKYGVISFSIPFLNLTLYYIIFTIEGIFLIIAGFTVW